MCVSCVCARECCMCVMQHALRVSVHTQARLNHQNARTDPLQLEGLCGSVCPGMPMLASLVLKLVVCVCVCDAACSAGQCVLSEGVVCQRAEKCLPRDSNMHARARKHTDTDTPKRANGPAAA